MKFVASFPVALGIASVPTTLIKELSEDEDRYGSIARVRGAGHRARLPRRHERHQPLVTGRGDDAGLTAGRGGDRSDRSGRGSALLLLRWGGQGRAAGAGR